jgi:hypothetical protein
LEAQQHKKYAQTTPLDDGVSSLFLFLFSFFFIEIFNRFAKDHKKNIQSLSIKRNISSKYDLIF